MKIICCRDCPIAQETEAGMIAADLGCLPSNEEVRKWFTDTGKLWACHSTPTKPCAGLLRDLIKKGATIDFSKELITEKSTLEEIYGSNEIV